MTDTKRKATPDDVTVGANLRGIRTGLELTMEESAERVRLSRQQIEKYESGESRISAGMIARLSCVYGADLSRIFHGVKTGGDPAPAASPEALDIASRIDRLPRQARNAIIGNVTALERTT